MPGTQLVQATPQAAAPANPIASPSTTQQPATQLALQGLNIQQQQQQQQQQQTQQQQQQQQLGGIQIVQQIVGPNGEIQQIPVSDCIVCLKNYSSICFYIFTATTVGTATSNDSDATWSSREWTTNSSANSSTSGSTGVIIA